jgi:hypothetical protein
MRMAVLFLLCPTLALAAPLNATVARTPVEPAVVVVPANAGRTTLARYRSGATATSGTPLVVIVRLADAAAADAITVSDAHRDGPKIAITIDSRRSLAAADTTPLVEIELGTLPEGTYTIDIAEQIRRVSKDNIGKPQRGLVSSITLTVQ